MKYIYIGLVITCILFAWATGDFLIVQLIPPVPQSAPEIVKWAIAGVTLPDNLMDWLFPKDPVLSTTILVSAFVVLMVVTLIIASVTKLGKLTRFAIERCLVAFVQGTIVGGAGWLLGTVANLNLTPWLYGGALIGAILAYLLVNEVIDYIDLPSRRSVD